MTIALIAHDGKKADLVSFALQNKKLFEQHDIIATNTTGTVLEEAGFRRIEKMLSGPLGGDAQIAAKIATKGVHLVIFFRDPLDKHPHEPDVQMLMRLCDVHNIPLVTNLAGAKLVLTAVQDATKGYSE